MKNRLLLSIILLLVPQCSFGTASSLEVLKSPDGQLVFVISESHDSTNPNEGGNYKVVKSFVDVLNSAADKEWKYHVLLEAHELTWKKKDPDFLEGLLPLAPELLNTTVEDIEMRTLSGAGMFILGNECPLRLAIELKDEKLQKVYFESYGCHLDELTFNDVLEEFIEQVTEAVKFRNHWAEEGEFNCVDTFDIPIYSMARKYQAFEALLEEYGIDPSQKILEATLDPKLSKMGEIDFPKKRTLKRVVLEHAIKVTGAKLFDLFLFDRIAALRKNIDTRIVIIAGRGHTGPISSCLRDAGYERINKFIIPHKPLLADMLKPLSLPLEEIQKIKVNA